MSRLRLLRRCVGIFRPALFAALVTTVAFLPFFLSDADDVTFLTILLVLPVSVVVCLALLGAATSLWRTGGAKLFMAAAVIPPVPYLMFVHRESLRHAGDRSYWMLYGGSWKKELARQMIYPGNDLAHLEWDASGFGGMSWTSYVVFDPSDELDRFRDQDGFAPHVPCRIGGAQRLGKHYYVVSFYEYAEWDNCADELNSSSRKTMRPRTGDTSPRTGPDHVQSLVRLPRRRSGQSPLDPSGCGGDPRGDCPLAGPGQSPGLRSQLSFAPRRTRPSSRYRSGRLSTRHSAMRVGSATSTLRAVAVRPAGSAGDVARRGGAAMAREGGRGASAIGAGRDPLPRRRSRCRTRQTRTCHHRRTAGSRRKNTTQVEHQTVAVRNASTQSAASRSLPVTGAVLRPPPRNVARNDRASRSPSSQGLQVAAGLPESSRSR